MKREQAIEILQRMSNDGYYGSHVHDALRMGAEALEKQKEQKPVHTAKEMWKEMRLEVYAQASGNRHEPNYSDDSTKMFSLCDIDEIFEKIGNSTVGSQPAEWREEDELFINEKMLIALRAEYEKGVADTVAKYEQKPLSTEETELNSIAFLEQLGYTCIPPSEQKPTELSKEDKETNEEITSNPEYKHHNTTNSSDSDKTALYKIAFVLSRNEDKDGSPLEQIRSILIDNVIEGLEK